MILAARYEIWPYGTNQFRFKLIAPNNETIAVSEGYTTKEGCKAGILAVQTHAQTTVIDDKT